MTTMMSKDLFQFRTFGFIGPVTQIFVIAGLFIALIGRYYLEAKAAGNVGLQSTFAVSLLFVPIYEELIFRGFLLGYFENITSKLKAIIFVSILFGIWHLKNIFWFDYDFIVRQVAYTTFIFSPLVCFLTLRLRSVWPAVMLHFMNNLIF